MIKINVSATEESEMKIVCDGLRNAFPGVQIQATSSIQATIESKSQSPGTSLPTILFKAALPASEGLVTNEYVHWNKLANTTDWDMTSGSLFYLSGAFTSLKVDDLAPNQTSSNGTNNAVFRLTTVRKDFQDCRVRFKLQNQAFSSTAKFPAVAWDGVHVFLRYQTEESLYYASVNRRDKTVVFKKKCPGGPSNNGTYWAGKTGTFNYGSDWQDVAVTMRTIGTGVSFEMIVNGQSILSDLDDGKSWKTDVAGAIQCAPIWSPGATGIRGDNCVFQFKDFQVEAI